MRKLNFLTFKVFNVRGPSNACTRSSFFFIYISTTYPSVFHSQLIYLPMIVLYIVMLLMITMYSLVSAFHIIEDYYKFHQSNINEKKLEVMQVLLS